MALEGALGWLGVKPGVPGTFIRQGEYPEAKRLTDLTTIPAYRRQPLRFPRRLAVLCYALSLVAHASVAVWMANTPVPPASPFAGSASDMPDGPRRPVTVTMVMKMTDFAQPGQSMPSDRVAPPSDTPPTRQSDINQNKPQAEPASAGGQQPAPQPPRPEPTQTVKADPVDPVDPEPINKPDPPAQQSQQPDGPERHATADPTDPTPNTPQPATTPEQKPADPIDLAQLAQQTRYLIENVLPALAQLTRSSPANTSNNEDAPAPDSEPQTKPVQTAEADDTPEPEPKSAEPSTEQNPEPSTSTAESTPTEQDTPDNNPPAVVYDEDSVDQPIAFKSMARPKPSSVSRRLGDSGTIVIRVEVDTDGSLLGHEVIDDAGQPRLLAAALDALNESTFQPAQRDGVPVRSTRIIEYRF